MSVLSLPYRAATTNYLCCDQALEDSKGAGRMGLTRISVIEISPHVFLVCGCKGRHIFQIGNTFYKKSDVF